MRHAQADVTAHRLAAGGIDGPEGGLEGLKLGDKPHNTAPAASNSL
ncbi:hypothetical protein SPH9361_04925 [Sphingobium sp. CECT 9361]|nr:hypothetical protein SPH9361_04925 [Sphingobium sp. CECT 9361]